MAAAVVTAAAWFAAGAAQAEPIVGLASGTGGTSLVRFDSATPNATTVVAVSGLVGDTSLVGIDLRPTTGLVYGVGSAGGLYTLNTATGAATKVGQMDTALSGTVFGVDFNPVPDLAGAASLRITSDTGQNLRVNVNAGLIGVTAVDTNLNGTASGQFASAYTNNDIDPSTATALYGIFGSGTTFSLYQQTNPNGGVLATIGDLGVDLTSSLVGFDVSALAGATFASLSTPDAFVGFGLYSISLANGAATLLGNIGISSALSLIDITAVTAPIPEPETYALMLAGLAGLAAVARRRKARAAAAG